MTRGLINRPTTARERIIVALDVDTVDEAERIRDSLEGTVGAFKIGLQLLSKTSINRYDGAGSVFTTDDRVMVDLKLHDIPNTMLKAVRAVAGWQSAWSVTVHASAGQAALEACVAATDGNNLNIFAVTVLTSLTTGECQKIYGQPSFAAVRKMAWNAADSAVSGIICAPTEAGLVRELFTLEMSLDDAKCPLIVTPGVRPKWAQKDDQARIMTPRQAVDAGADYLVIGRPITKPPSGMTSRQAAERIIEELEA